MILLLTKLQRLIKDNNGRRVIIYILRQCRCFTDRLLAIHRSILVVVI